MKQNILNLVRDLWWLPLLFIVWGAIARGNPDASVPMRYTPDIGETLEELAKRYDLVLEDLETLNPAGLGQNRRLLLLYQPRDRDEAVELLEEAKHAESVSDPSARKAALLYHGILESARLVDSEGKEGEAAEAVEIPSETVAQALMGWGRVNEIEDPEQSRWAYEQVAVFFPDLEEICQQAGSRLAALAENGRAVLASPPPSAVEMFPAQPHIILDIDTVQLKKEYPKISLYQALRSLSGSEDKKLSRFMKDLEEGDALISKILDQTESIHAGAWIDLGIPPQKPGGVTGLIVAKLSASPEEFVKTMDLGRPEGDYNGTDYWNVDGNAYIAFKDGWAFFGEEEEMRLAGDRQHSRRYESLLNRDSPYQRMRRQLGAGATIFGYVDAEAVLEGPALSFAKSVDPEVNYEELVQSLIVSGILGLNSIQGLALALSTEDGNLTASLALAHGGKGIFHVLRSEPCESAIPSFLPPDLDGMASLRIACDNIPKALSAFVNVNLLGKAAPIYTAQYETLVKHASTDLGFHIDPLHLLQEGLGSELSLGVRIPEGIIPIPNLLVALPVGDSKTVLDSVEKVMAKDLKMEFQEEQAEGHWYRHTLLPEVPIPVDVSYTLVDGVLLVASNPSLLVDSIRAHKSGDNLQANAGYRDFRASIPSPGNLQIYLARSLAKGLAIWGKSPAVLSSIPESHQEIREVLKTSLDQIIDQPDASGVGLVFAEDRVQASLRLSNFRPLLVSFLCLTKGQEMREHTSESHDDPGGKVAAVVSEASEEEE